MIVLVSGLLGLAGLLAERALSTARRPSLGAGPRVRPERGRRVQPDLARIAWLLPPVVTMAVAGLPVAIVVLVASAVASRAVAKRRRISERRRGQEQLADAVAAMAAGLRGGLSLTQALRYARDEAQPPLEATLTRLVGRTELGVSVGDALAGWAEEVDSEDARLVAGVLDLHRQSGGDLPWVLDGLAVTLRDRQAAYREVRALTSQARLSGVILGTLPIGFFAFLLITSSREMVQAIGTPLGRGALAVGLGLEVLAFLWIRRLLEVR
jgi:tight adherence protein B